MPITLLLDRLYADTTDAIGYSNLTSHSVNVDYNIGE